MAAAKAVNNSASMVAEAKARNSAAAFGGGSREGCEETATQYLKANGYDLTRSGARLILHYDPVTQSYTGTAENTTVMPLRQGRVEVHLSNGVDLGSTQSRNFVPGQRVNVSLPAQWRDLRYFGSVSGCRQHRFR